MEQQLVRLGAEVLLPMMKTRVRRWDCLVESLLPLFPCYLFARFDFARDFDRLRYTRGLREIVCCAGRPAPVPDWIAVELAQRCAQGPVELPPRRFMAGERVRVASGRLRDLEGVFERYLSGPERVAVLLSVMGAGARAVLPSNMLAPAT